MVPLAPALAAQIDELERLASQRDDAYQITRAAGETLAAVAITTRAQVVVEVGTSYGFSGLWWAAALGVTGGHLHTIDVSEKKHAAAKEAFAAAGVVDRVTLYLGVASEILPGAAEPIDVAFIDADKPSTQTYFDLVWPKVRAGGAVLTDNVISHQQELTRYVSGLRARDDAHSVTLPIGGGLEWTVKLG